MKENDITKQVVDAALKVHIALGPGLLESVYETTLAYDLEARGLDVERQKAIPVFYKGIRLEAGFRADLVVGGFILLEIKSVQELASVHKKQLLTYLRLSNLRVGLLLNFGAEFIRDGIVRVVNGLL